MGRAPVGGGYGIGYVRLGNGYCDLHTVHSTRDMPYLFDWLHEPERSNRVVLLLASMSRRDRRSVVRRLEALGLKRRRPSRADRSSLRRQLRTAAPPQRPRQAVLHRLAALGVTAVTAPIWVPATVVLRLAGRGYRRLIFDGCAALGTGRPGAGPAGGRGPAGPDGGDRSPRRRPGGSGSLAVELEPPTPAAVVEPPPARGIDESGHR